MPNESELLPGLVLPPPFQNAFRKRLADIGQADSAVNCLIAQARAEGMVEGLETVTQGIPTGQIERLYLLIEQAASERLAELEQLI
ncbi:hypothetical protein [Pseudomonas monteilii]|uniref:hypothetical protein n=1 Tax=Pseudomonas monteilii TaxID=76759 RepID=UPI003F6E1C1A